MATMVELQFAVNGVPPSACLGWSSRLNTAAGATSRPRLMALEMEYRTPRPRCVRCDCPIDARNDSVEHVIPNSVGGRLKVRGFICARCNSETGESWDKTLSEHLNFFCLFFGVVRERGDSRPQPIETTAGEHLLMQPGGGFKMQKPIFQEVPTAAGKRIQIKARTMGEAAAMLGGAARKYPQVDVAAELAKATEAYTYPEGVLLHSPEFGGISGGRSVVKTATAFAFHSGVPTDQCVLALAYLRDEAAAPPFGYFYERDLVNGRPASVPIHCVAVVGFPETGMLLGYVEYFGVQRVVVCLSQSYNGPAIARSYALDPTTGKTVPVQVDLTFSATDIQSIYNYERIPDGGIARAFAEVVPAVLARSFEREKARAIKDATRYAFENCGAKPGDMLTVEQTRKLASLAAERLMPFIQRHARRSR
jgi:HNH endonuclease